MSNKNGIHWCRDSTRLAVYLRDGLRCLWCHGAGELTLDHFLPRSRGGSNAPDNLVTSCKPCNDARKALAAMDFAPFEDVSRVVDVLLYRALPRKDARGLLAVHGTCAKAVRALREPGKARPSGVRLELEQMEREGLGAPGEGL